MASSHPNTRSAPCHPPSSSLAAAGRVGQVITREFATAGWQVLAQARKALPTALQAEGRITAVRCDATEVAALTESARGASVVVNALNPPLHRVGQACPAAGGCRLAVARNSGALLMLPGNVYNHGRELPPLLTAHTPERGDTPKARTRIEMEGRLSAAAGTGVDSVVIRAGDFLRRPGHRHLGWTWPSRPSSNKGASLTPATPASRTPGPTSPTWRRPSCASRHCASACGVTGG